MSPVMATPSNTIVLLTDFGTSDPYVGIMKGVIAGLTPSSIIIDLTHQIQPQDILETAFLLSTSYRQFPEGTIFVCVVDPGVGTVRVPVLVAASGYYFIGPDNGLLGFLNETKDKTIIQLRNHKYFREPVSATFHGRDIFAPVAALLARDGAEIIRDLGPEGDTLMDIRERLPEITQTRITGTIVHIDRFGNLISTIHRSHLDGLFHGGTFSVSVKDISVPFVRTYAEAPDNTPCSLLDSASHLEIFVKGRNAQKFLNLQTGEKVYVTGNNR